MNFLHLVLFTIKMGSEFSLFGATILAVSKIDPAVIGSSSKRCEIIPLLSPIILYHHILPLLRLRKSYESALWTSWNPGCGENISVVIPLLTRHTQVSNILGFGRGKQIYTNWTRNGGENWG